MRTITLDDFLKDSQGRRFADVANDTHVQWGKWIDWLNDKARQDRLEMAEVHFDMPALAGILKELEAEPFVRDYFARRTPQATLRTKQALGVLVKLHMEARGWRTTGIKGPLGRRDPTSPAPEVAGEPRPVANLNTKYTFEQFVVGSSNRFAHAASMAVAA